MRRATTHHLASWSLAALVLVGAAACETDDLVAGDGDAGSAATDAGGGASDSGTPGDAGGPVDAGAGPDAGSPDAGGGECTPPALDCGSGCVDPQTSALHCGGCGRPCGADETCSGGQCRSTLCADRCQSAGARQCSGDGLRECVASAEVAGCLQWSAVEPCPDGTACDPGTLTCREPCGDFCDPFSIVLLPDTQYYTSKQPNDAGNTYRRQMNWILDHRDSNNIQFVVHLGDITNANLPAQWEAADAAHDLLDAAAVPYSVVTGNHDYLVSGSFERGGSLFDDYFPKSRFAGKAWYGGSYGSSNANNYTYFQVGPMKFMVLSLEYSPRKDVLCWANDLVASHPDHRVIIATHCYLTHGGGYSGGCPDPDYAALGASGSGVWEELASRHSNVFLVVSGHIGDSEHRVRRGNAGNDVHEMLVDYQFEASCTAASAAGCTNHCQNGTYTGNGWMRELVFAPRSGTVEANTFTVEAGNAAFFPGGTPAFFCSPLFAAAGTAERGDDWYAQDPASPEHQFSFAYDLNSPTAYQREDLGKRAFIDRTVNSASAGDQLAPQVALSPEGAVVVAWEDNSSADDGEGNHDVLVRGLAAGGCAGFSDRPVHSVTAGHQEAPALAMDAAGNFVVVWADDQDGNGTFQILGRGFAADGSERIAQFTANSTAAGQQRNPAIAMAPDGRFVVAWEDDQDGDGKAQIMMRGFGADGRQAFAQRNAAVDLNGVRVAPSLALDAGGRLVVAWQDDSDANGSFQIHARGFNADGTERFGRITVNGTADGQQRNPSVGADAAGGFVVAWEDDQANDGNFDIVARGFRADGTERLADFVVHAAAAGTHLAPKLTMEPAGAFAVAWQDDGDADAAFRIRARSFRADGTQWKAEWRVNRVDSGQQRAPGFALNATGAMAAAWEDDMDGNGTTQIVARGFDSP